MAKKGGMDFLSEYSEKFGKPDLERLGVFIEMPYMNGKGYVSPFPSTVVLHFTPIEYSVYRNYCRTSSR